MSTTKTAEKTEKRGILLLNVIGEHVEVAYAEGDTILARRELKHQNHLLSENMLFNIDELMSDRSVSELEMIVVGKGPGQFTRIRVACAVANALAYAHDVKIAGVAGEVPIEKMPAKARTLEKRGEVTNAVMPDYGYKDRHDPKQHKLKALKESS